jgi:cellulose synthase/poly-beta-1,6-N-acetylglucosamine synthase-like glycosyltransferase
VERSATRRSTPGEAATRSTENRWLVVIPSRAEGESVRKTIESVKGAGVATLLLLDGEDIAARRVGEEMGAEVVQKDPSGPTKAIALGWLAEKHRDRLLRSDAVLLLDVGSTLTVGFFDALTWPAGCDAIQARLRGVGSGVGIAAAQSETHAQLDEDCGREALGWSVRLRGTGSAFRSATFIDISPRLRTRVEYLEATLLIIARGGRVTLGGAGAVVNDEKPPTVYSAALQRARWLLGRYELLVKRAPDFLRALVWRPAETTALFFEIFGRPLSLTIPFRLIVAAAAIASGRFVIGAALILATAIFDAIAILASGRAGIGAVRLMIAWALAVVMAPRALFRWMRAKRL